MSFTVIETQEQFDEAIKERLAREKKKFAEQYADYDDMQKKLASYEKQTGELTTQIDTLAKEKAEHDQIVSELKTQVAGYETAALKSRVAHEVGLPYELAGRLSGDDEDAIRKDAEVMKGLIGSTQKVQPLGSTEEPVADDKTEGLKQMLSNMRGE